LHKNILKSLASLLSPTGRTGAACGNGFSSQGDCAGRPRACASTGENSITRIEELLRRHSPGLHRHHRLRPNHPCAPPHHSKFGWINLHASLLPKYRGAAPIQWAIANGETQTGLTTMRIDAAWTREIFFCKNDEHRTRRHHGFTRDATGRGRAPLMAETLRGVERHASCEAPGPRLKPHTRPC